MRKAGSDQTDSSTPPADIKAPTLPTGGGEGTSGSKVEVFCPPPNSMRAETDWQSWRVLDAHALSRDDVKAPTYQAGGIGGTTGLCRTSFLGEVFGIVSMPTNG